MVDGDCDGDGDCEGDCDGDLLDATMQVDVSAVVLQLVHLAEESTAIFLELILDIDLHIFGFCQSWKKILTRWSMLIPWSLLARSASSWCRAWHHGDGGEGVDDSCNDDDDIGDGDADGNDDNDSDGNDDHDGDSDGNTENNGDDDENGSPGGWLQVDGSPPQATWEWFKFKIRFQTY